MSLLSLTILLAVAAALAAIPRRTRKAAILALSLLVLAGLTAVAYASARVEKPAVGGGGPLALAVPAGLTPPDYHEPLEAWRAEHSAYVRASEAGETECLGCHADPETFCNRCHTYVGVSLIAAPAPVGAPVIEGGEEAVGAPTVEASGPTTSAPSFSGDVQPILNQKCAACHGVLGGLSLASRADVLKGGQHGPAILPGDAEGSLLIQALRGPWSEGQRMPPGGEPLPEAEIDSIARWIEAGAPDN